MSISTASERRFLSHDESEIVTATHYPAIAELDAERLRESRTQLRQLRDKAKTITRHRQRGAAGKGERRAAASGTVEHAARRKQIFAQALKRANRQLERLDHAAARARTAGGKQKALAMRRRAEAAIDRPSAGRHAHPGMRANPSLRRAMGVEGAQVGRVSAHGKRTQAKRDAAG
jgi:hypothetical protein